VVGSADGSLQEKGKTMTRSSLTPFVTGVAALTAALGLAAACPQQANDNIPNDAELTEQKVTILRVEIDATSLPGGASGFRAAISTLDVHQQGGWKEYEAEDEIHVAAGEVATILRVVEPDASINIVRILGEFTLTIDGEETPVTVTPARGVQVKLNQPLTAGAVNHVRIDLGAALEAKAKGWRLHPSVKADVVADATAVAGAAVTPGAGGALELDDGFRIEVPPGAVADDVLIHAEKVTDDVQTYYLVGPEGMGFSAPVTASVPGTTPEPVVSWDQRQIAGEFDIQGRAVVQNNHFSCLLRDDEPETMTPLGERSFLFEGKECGAKYSVVVTDLHDPHTRVFSGMSPNKHDKLGDAGGNCSGQQVFDDASLPTIFGDKPGYRRIAAIPGDIYECEGDPWGDCHTGCARDGLTAEGEQIRTKDNPEVYSFYLGFDSGQPKTSFMVEKAPFITNTLMNSSYRYVKEGKADFTVPLFLPMSPTNEEVIELFPGCRNSIGISQDKRFMFLATAENCMFGLDGSGWAELLTRKRSITIAGQDLGVSVYNAYRMDEGGTTALVYSDAGMAWQAGAGSRDNPDGTIMGLALYERCHVFADVSEGAWYFEPVMELVCRGVIDKKPVYKPGDGTNRVEYLKIQLELAFPKISFKTKPAKPPFPDVPVDAWYAPYVEFAKNAKIVQGYPDKTFKPEEVIDRAEAARITVDVGSHPGAAQRFKDLNFAYNALLKDGDVNLEKFPDVKWADMKCPKQGAEDSETCWYYHAVYALREFGGAVCGDGVTGKFEAAEPVNRAETAKIACIVAGYCDSEDC